MKEHFVRPNCSQTRLAVLYKPSCIYNALFIDVGFVTLFAQNTTVETRALYVTCLPLLAKVLKSFTQSYSKRDAPKQQQSLRTRMGHFSASLLCHRHKPLPAKPQPTWPSGVQVQRVGRVCLVKLNALLPIPNHIPIEYKPEPRSRWGVFCLPDIPVSQLPLPCHKPLGYSFFSLTKKVIILKTKLSAKVQDPCSEKYTSIFRLRTSSFSIAREDSPLPAQIVTNSVLENSAYKTLGTLTSTALQWAFTERTEQMPILYR